MVPPDDAIGEQLTLILDATSEASDGSRPNDLRAPIGQNNVRAYVHGETGAIPIRFTKPIQS